MGPFDSPGLILHISISGAESQFLVDRAPSARLRRQVVSDANFSGGGGVLPSPHDCFPSRRQCPGLRQAVCACDGLLKGSFPRPWCVLLTPQNITQHRWSRYHPQIAAFAPQSPAPPHLVGLSIVTLLFLLLFGRRASPLSPKLQPRTKQN